MTTASMTAAPHILDVVELRVAAGAWAAGTRGTIVEAFPEDALVEITDGEGRALDVVGVPYSALRRVDTAAQTRFAVDP